MTGFIAILITSILVENYVLSKFLAICSFLGVSKNLKSAMGMSVAVIFVMLVATAVTWPVYYFVLEPNNLGYLQTIVFILVIAALVQFVEMFIKKSSPSLYSALGIFLPLITTNCAVLGVVVLNITKSYTFAESLVNTLGAGLGYMLAMFLFNGVRSKVDNADVPASFKGVPITLCAASIVSISFMGFSGLVTGLFG
ncbi:MAG: electron transport complex protein RnfA [Candidatus Alectryocaccobium sp.]|jgi:electron transport complex protein RnfA|nr:RnfABCDGE type electron transport complex subunit A [Lachnospiraceae bacterium]MDY6222202.1 RnfABCDGE type electron transport complex subunit A [Candidatus Alectryocaccobium sp.]